jgi:glycosyltransferase involved in cell wall biosynthesis
MISHSLIAHLTSVHSRYDTRVFHKFCCTLETHEHQVHLVVADGMGNEAFHHINIHDVGASSSRRDRILNAPKRVFAKALELKADLYHLHDPELLPIGLKLKQIGKRVIFDSHEDVPRQMLSKPYLNKPALWAMAQVLRGYEVWACRQLDGVIGATPFIRDKFLQINPSTVNINNYPILAELSSSTPWAEKQPEVCYVGGIGQIRGIIEVVEAMGRVRSVGRLNLAGRFGDSGLESQLQAQPGWQRVNPLGFVDRAGVRDVLARSMAGVVTFHPLPNHIDAQPNKMFEYMSAGIPVIASDFPLWREIIDGNDCGLLVDPLNPTSIAEAIDYLITHPQEAERMGRNGRSAVESHYNWEHEGQKLLAFYDKILSPAALDHVFVG